ncbi:stage III sporulation protein AC [Alicyclobacillus dauci]|uniref:Stage III sporulation protein AC n=1 Tax=Alicyclobacillus dauci TaxID=1475485 RepID=A0ABY6Z7X8_9BACL|nr:stage III sporulation protein AC [Alicyclobacillus dauci]WAH38997.1 stage III sporulation protein AC [Alicyclobacillus dauci]
MTPEIRDVFRIFAVGFIAAILHTVLKQSGKEDFAHWATLVGFVAVLAIVVGYIDHLYREITSVFLLQ